MVGFALIVEGMSITPRPVLWSGIDFGGGGSVMVWGGVSQHHRTELVVIAGNLKGCALQGIHPPSSCGTLPAGSS